MIRCPHLKPAFRPVRVTFWGTRGSIPTPGRSTLRYGGNTSCIEIRRGKDQLILDGGTGIRMLGLQNSRPSLPISILVSHTHSDHIGGIPFFLPALKKGRVIRIFGPPGLKKALGNLFPFPVLLSRKKVYEINSGVFRLVGFRIASTWLNHPGGSLGYRIGTSSGRSIVYLSDHEPSHLFSHHQRDASDQTLLRWMQQADLLIMDAQHLDQEYPKRKGWGHSPVSYVTQLALRARVKRLVLFHHDPAHSDRILEKKLAAAQKLIARSGRPMPCLLAREGQTIGI